MYSVSLNIRQMKTKTTLRFHLSSVIMAIIKKSVNDTDKHEKMRKMCIFLCSWGCTLLQNCENHDTEFPRISQELGMLCT